MKFSHKKLFNICCIGLLGAIFLAPNLGLLDEEKNIYLISEMENRTINPAPVAFLTEKNFYCQLEEWYNDRILGRRDLIRRWAQLNGSMFDILISKEIVKGNKGYYFSPPYMSRVFNDKELKIASLTRLSQQCTAYGAAFTVMLAPNSEFVLEELFPGGHEPVPYEKLDGEFYHSLEKAGVNSVFLTDRFNKLPVEEQEQMYYKGDYHWNDIGAYLAARELLNSWQLGEKLNYITTSVATEKTAAIYTRRAGIKPIKEIVAKPWHKNYTSDFTYTAMPDGLTKQGYYQGENGRKGEDVHVNKNATYKKTILILGDSFSGILVEYLLQDVEKVVFSHNRDLSGNKQAVDIDYLLNTYKPDYVVYEKMSAYFYNNAHSTEFGNIKFK